MTLLTESTLTFKGIYRAKVLDNADPLKLGRCKLEVYGAFHDMSADDKVNLPWARPAFPLSVGAGTAVGSVYIPTNGTFVFAFFEYGNMYQPVYFAEAQTAIHGLPTLKDENDNYPNVRGFMTPSGIQFFIDDTDEHIKLLHPTGTFVEVQTDGDVYVQPNETHRSIHRAFSHTIQSLSSGTLTGKHGGLIRVSGSGTITCPDASAYPGMVYLFKRLDDGVTVVTCPPNIEATTFFELGSIGGGKWAGKAIISDGTQWVYRP